MADDTQTADEKPAAEHEADAPAATPAPKPRPGFSRTAATALDFAIKAKPDSHHATPESLVESARVFEDYLLEARAED